MPKRRYLSIDSEREAELKEWRDHHPKPYVRERAAALLKIAAGQSGHEVARRGLLKPRDPDTVYSWLKAYEEQGISSLLMSEGRGRMTAYNKAERTAPQAQEELLQVVRRSPTGFGYDQSRWGIAQIQAQVPWLAALSYSRASEVLAELNLSYKRGRTYLHSPDPLYLEKVALIQQWYQQAVEQPTRYAFLYLDEMSFYRQPTVAAAFEACGTSQPLARLSYAANRHHRIVGALDALSGQVHSHSASKITLAVLSDFLAQLATAYADRETIFLVADNWPCHFHPDVLVHLSPQQWLCSPKLPHNWPTTPSLPAPAPLLPIQFLNLPTYAPWLNPIEKLWRWVRQKLCHLHPYADHWPELIQHVNGFLLQFASPSPTLLRYVGLLPI